MVDMKKHYILGAFLVALGLTAPQTSQANTALQLGDNAALFTINFSIEDNLFDNYFPILTKVNAGHNEKTNRVGYVLERESTESNAVEAVSAIVLSNAGTYENGRYMVPAGTAANFTLLIVATFAEDLQQDYRARITKIPYWLDGRRTMVHQNQLDELATPVLEIE